MDLYTVEVNGIKHTVQLDDEAAKLAGLTAKDKASNVEARGTETDADADAAAAKQAEADAAAKAEADAKAAADAKNKSETPKNK